MTLFGLFRPPFTCNNPFPKTGHQVTPEGLFEWPLKSVVVRIRLTSFMLVLLSLKHFKNDYDDDDTTSTSTTSTPPTTSTATAPLGFCPTILNCIPDPRGILSSALWAILFFGSLRRRRPEDEPPIVVVVPPPGVNITFFGYESKKKSVPEEILKNKFDFTKH